MTIDLTDHVLEQELRAAPPRRVRFSSHAFLVCVASALLLGAFGACGLAALTEAVRLTILHAQGRTAMAVVTEIDYSTGEPPTRSRSRWDPANAAAASQILYRFRASDGHRIVARLPLSIARYDVDGRVTQPLVFLPGARFPVRYARIDGRLVSRPESNTAPNKIAFLVAAGLAAAAIGVALFWKCVSWLASARKLVSTGCVSVGTVLGKESTLEDSSRFTITFAYPTSDGAVRFRQAACSASQFQRFRAGQTLTVVYPADRPGEATPYVLLPFGH